MLAVISLIAELGKDVVVDGRVAKVIAQHLVTTVPGKRAVYFDVPGSSQTVAYVPKGFDCADAALLEGKVIEVKGGGKRQKSEEVFTEAHLDVTKWTCMPATVDGLLEKKDEAGIVALGRAAIPGLIRRLDDTAVYAVERRLLNEAELTNRPGVGKGTPEQWAEVPVTVADRCRDLLDRITTLVPTSRSKPIGPAHVDDWAAWWRARWSKSLDELRAERAR